MASFSESSWNRSYITFELTESEVRILHNIIMAGNKEMACGTIKMLLKRHDKLEGYNLNANAANITERIAAVFLHQISGMSFVLLP